MHIVIYKRSQSISCFGNHALENNSHVHFAIKATKSYDARGLPGPVPHH